MVHFPALKRWLFSLLLLVLLGGCTLPGGWTGAVSAVPASAEASSTQPAALLSPTITTPPPSPAASPSPTATTAPSATLRPSPTATPTHLACLGEPPRQETGSLRFPGLKLPLEYFVFLPPCYDQQPERRYSVLYMIHGQSFNHDQWDRLGADEAMAALSSEGEIAPFILVLPRDRVWSQPDEDLFGLAVIDALLPTIDANYRTIPDRAHRAIGGLSRGAAWAVHLGLRYWQLFGAIGAHSLPVFWSDVGLLPGWFDAIPPEQLPRIFLDSGDHDYLLRSTRWFVGLLDRKAIPHEWYLFPGYHEEAYWQAHVEMYIRWYAKDW